MYPLRKKSIRFNFIPINMIYLHINSSPKNNMPCSAIRECPQTTMETVKKNGNQFESCL